MHHSNPGLDKTERARQRLRYLLVRISTVKAQMAFQICWAPFPTKESRPSDCKEIV